MRSENKLIKPLLSVLVVLVLIYGTFIIRNVRSLHDVKFGKMLYLDLIDDNMDADYVKKLLLKESSNSKLGLVSLKELKKMIAYMRKNNLKIMPGEYEIWQESDYEQLIASFEFTTNPYMN